MKPEVEELIKRLDPEYVNCHKCDMLYHKDKCVIFTFRDLPNLYICPGCRGRKGNLPNRLKYSADQIKYQGRMIKNRFGPVSP